MNKKAFNQIKSCFFKEVKYTIHDDQCVITLWLTLEENCIHAISQVHGFQMKPNVSIQVHVSRLFKDNDKQIKVEVKGKILLHSLLEEYNHKQSLCDYIYACKSMNVFKNVGTILTNLKNQNNDKYFEWASFKALMGEEYAIKKMIKQERILELIQEV